MIRRIVIIFLLTGVGQLFSVFALKFILHHTTTEQVSAIAEVDTNIQLIISLIAFGLQSAAIRNLATTVGWEQEYASTQTARFTLGLLLLLVCTLAFHDKQYLVYMAAPVLALNGDFALYARGFPVMGAFIAFLRAVIPFSLLIITLAYLPEQLAEVYFAGLVITYLITNLFISRFLKTRTFYIPDFKKLALYVKNLHLGFISLSFYFLGLGILMIAKYMYTAEILAIAYLSIKLYVIFKGVLRVIHQAFIKDMLKDSVCLKIDQMSSVIGLIFLTAVLSFPASFITTFFGERFIEQKMYFSILGISAMIYSLFLSGTTKSLLEKKDKLYTVIMVAAVITAFVSLVMFSFISNTLNDIAISLLLGEIVMAIGMIKLSLNIQQVMERFKFLLMNTLLVVIPLLARFFFSDSLPVFFISFAIFSSLLLLLHYKKFYQV